MRRKPSTQGGGGQGGGFNNQQRKQRYQQGGSGGGEHRSHNHNNGGRPRKNYTAMREKYLAQARDALASGDRVLAENYFQHADHCYRMMVEEGYQVRNTFNNNQDGNQDGNSDGQSDEQSGNVENQPEHSSEEHMPQVGSQLPAFLTASFDPNQNQQPAEPVIVPSWEE